MSRQPIKIIKKSEMEANFNMAEAIDCMEKAFSKLSSGECFVPKRYVAATGDDSLTFLMKPAIVESNNRSSIKILTQKNVNSFPGIPTIIGIVLLIDNVTGEILSIMDGEYITDIRTGAAGGLATKYFSRINSRNLALFGCGSQGKTQLKAVDAVRDIQKVWVFDKSADQAESFIREMSDETNAVIEYTDNLSVLKDADIICTATNSKQPLFQKEHLKDGTHINAIGSFRPDMQEIDPAIIWASRIYLDDADSCVKESGDLLNAVKDDNSQMENIIGEIGDYILGKIDGRISENDTTIFKSVGTAIQDYEIAENIYEKFLTNKFGEEIKLYE